MKLVNGGLKGTVTLRNKQGKRQMLNKKMVLGTEYRLFFPTCRLENGERDIIAATVPGRKLNFDKLGVSFVRLDDYDLDDNGNITDLTGLVPYSKVTRVIHSAEAASMIEKAKKDAVEEADKLGVEVDKTALQFKIKEINDTYFGDRNAKPQPIYATQTAMIGGIIFESYTECLCVPLDKNGAPDWKEAEVVGFQLSGKKAKKLLQLVNSPDYCYADYLECGWSWKGATKQEAGRDADLQGIAVALSLKEKFPELWAANESKLDDIATDPEVMAGKNLTLSSKTTPKEVIELFKKYMSAHRALIASIDYEDDFTKSVAQDILNSGIVDSSEKYKAILRNIVAEATGNGTATESPALDALQGVNAEALAAAKSVGAVVDAIGDVDNALNDEDDGIDGL